MPITLTIYLDVLFVVVFLGVPALLIWLLVRRAMRRGRIKILSSDEVAHKREAEQRKAEEGWSLPPELDLPTPRPVRREQLGIRMLRSFKRLLPVIAILGLFTIIVMIRRGIRPGTLLNAPSVDFPAILNFLWPAHMPEWQLWPRIIFVGFVGVIVLSGYFRRKKQRKLLRWGKPACAVVTGCSGGDKGGTIWTLQYRDATGNLVETDLTSWSSRNATGQVLTVLYDPDKPSRCITYPVGGYEIGVPENS
ncbi:MAG: DUF3592 domain-containing protein [Terriglobia bacterium]|jgi:hypothetical protein